MGTALFELRCLNFVVGTTLFELRCLNCVVRIMLLELIFGLVSRRHSPKAFVQRTFVEDISASHISAYICTKGGIAQLARALAWHARGHRFESDYLHLKFP